MQQTRDYLIAAYLDWRNNYLTYEGYAERNGLTVEEAEQFINLARAVSEHPHPEA